MIKGGRRLVRSVASDLEAGVEHCTSWGLAVRRRGEWFEVVPPSGLVERYATPNMAALIWLFGVEDGIADRNRPPEKK